MPFRQTWNRLPSLTPADKVQVLRELNSLRTELDDIRSAVAAIRALLVAGTAVGAGYNTTATNIGPAITATPNQTPQFTAT